MSYFKKAGAVFLAFALAAATLPSAAEALPAILYQTSRQQTITSGATLEHISRFTADGWMNIKVLRIDTSNPNIKIDTLANKQITDKLATVLSLARENNAVAAVNAGFFNPLGTGMAYPDGPIIRGGDFLSTAAWYNGTKDNMASFSLDNYGQMLINYWKNNLTLAGPYGVSLAVSQYNQPSLQEYKDITVLDKKWGPYTLGVSEKYPDLIEILVFQGRVTEIRQAQPAAVMPADGFVVISRGAQAAKLLGSMGVGDPVQFTITSKPDWTGLQMSVTGASVLVKDGRIPEAFSFSDGSFSGKNPRTLAGISRDGKQLILVTVDGRQDNSIGLTQLESAQLMLELGAGNALIFDGGGSTTMVARQPGTDSLQVANVPSEGALRAVATGIGIYSLASPGPPAKLILETEDPNIFVNTSRLFSLKAVDLQANPVEIDPLQAEWSASGIEGTFSGNLFRPAAAGKGKVTARVGGLTAEIAIRSLSAPAKLVLSSNQLNVALGGSQSLQVTGYDQQGFKARIQPEDVRWTVNGQIGECPNGIFNASAAGTGYIEAAVGNAHAYSAVSVYSDVTEPVYAFEDTQAVFQANPQLARGSYQVSGEQVHGGNSAGQLTYDYYDTTTKDEVSLAFPGKGILLDSDTVSLAVWLYNTRENGNRILGEVLDSAGEKHQVEFAANLNWTGWKQIKATLGKLKGPAYLTRLFVQKADPVAGWGKIYFDDLSATVTKRPVADRSKVPGNTTWKDDANRTAVFTPGPDNFRFTVFGSAREPRNVLENRLLTKLNGYVNKNMDMALYAGAKAASAAKAVTKPVLITGTGYKASNYKNSTFIQLDTGKGGLRRSDPQQWIWLFKELEGMKGSNAFILMAGDPAAFINAKEAQLLKDTLAGYREKTGKNVWVFYQGTANQSQMDRGVRYISCAGFSAPGFSQDKPEGAKYLQATVRGNDITFEFKAL